MVVAVKTAREAFLPDLDRNFQVAALRPVLEVVMKTLTPREEKVLKLRFGWDLEEEERTLDSIAQDMNLSANRVREIQNKALRKLRHPSRSAFIAAAGVAPAFVTVHKDRFYLALFLKRRMRDMHSETIEDAQRQMRRIRRIKLKSKQDELSEVGRTRARAFNFEHGPGSGCGV